MRTRHLGDGELAVLKALWDLGKAQVREVQEHLQSQGVELAYNTVQTVLGRLVEKELVARDTRTSAHRFRALVDRKRFSRDRLKEIVSKIYDGDAGAVAFQLVEQSRLKLDEIEQLQELLRKLEQDKRKTPKRSS